MPLIVPLPCRGCSAACLPSPTGLCRACRGLPPLRKDEPLETTALPGAQQPAAPETASPSSLRKCARVLCPTMFVPQASGRKKHQKYCSKRCCDVVADGKRAAEGRPDRPLRAYVRGPYRKTLPARLEPTAVAALSHSREKVCKACGRAFVASSPRGRLPDFCTPECRRMARSASERERQAAVRRDAARVGGDLRPKLLGRLAHALWCGIEVKKAESWALTERESRDLQRRELADRDAAPWFTLVRWKHHDKAGKLVESPFWYARMHARGRTTQVVSTGCEDEADAREVGIRLLARFALGERVALGRAPNGSGRRAGPHTTVRLAADLADDVRAALPHMDLRAAFRRLVIEALAFRDVHGAPFAGLESVPSAGGEA